MSVQFAKFKTVHLNEFRSRLSRFISGYLTNFSLHNKAFHQKLLYSHTFTRNACNLKLLV